MSLSNHAQAQRARILEHLLKAPLTTQEARTLLDVMHPAARVQELREQGYNIFTHLRTIHTEKGRHNKVAEYVLLSRGEL